MDESRERGPHRRGLLHPATKQPSEGVPILRLPLVRRDSLGAGGETLASVPRLVLWGDGSYAAGVVTAQDRRVLWASAALASLMVLVAGAAGHEEVVACSAPLLVLVLPLLAGRYIGEERIARGVARLRRRRPRHRPVPTPRRLPRPAAVLIPRGGELIASALAERAPPVFVSG